MPTARTIDAAIAATLESAEEVLRGEGEGVARRAVAEELFADLAVDQLLKLTADSLMERASWSGYQSVSVARQLLDRVRVNLNRWGPSWSRCVADTALMIAERSDHATPTLLFEAHRWRASALISLARFDEALQSLDAAEGLAADTNQTRLCRATVARLRANACYETGRWSDALSFVGEAQDGFAACGATKLIAQTWACQGAALMGLKWYDEARRLHIVGLESAQASDDGELIAMYLGNIGQALFAMGDLRAARHHLDQACDFFASRGCMGIRAKSLATIGLIDISERGADGVQAIEEASAVFASMGMDADWVDTRIDLADALVSAHSSIDVSDICREAYERAVALGISGLAERALALLEPAVVRRSHSNNTM